MTNPNVEHITTSDLYSLVQSSYTDQSSTEAGEQPHRTLKDSAAPPSQNSLQGCKLLENAPLRSALLVCSVFNPCGGEHKLPWGTLAADRVCHNQHIVTVAGCLVCNCRFLGQKDEFSVKSQEQKEIQTGMKFARRIKRKKSSQN